MSRKTFLFAVAALLLLVALVYWLNGGHQTPPGQPALLSLSQGNFSEVKNSFNNASRSIRLIALLSPT